MFFNIISIFGTYFNIDDYFNVYVIAMDHMFMFMFIVLMPNFANIALASMKLLDS